MTKIEAEILRDAALRPTSIKLKNLKVGYEYYPSGAVSKVILSGRRASIPRLFEVLNMIYPRDVTVSVRGSEWYDRNPEPISNHYTATQAPHALSKRLSYTCPKNKIAFIEVLQAKVSRSTAATTEGLMVGYWISYVPPAITGNKIFEVSLTGLSLGDKDSKLTTIVLLPKTILEAYSLDLSTAGDVYIYFSYRGSEIDV